MNERVQKIIASTLELAVGVWLLVSPLVLAVSGAALVNVLIVGSVIALAGLAQLVWTNTLPSWVSAVAGMWLVASAFIFNVDSGFAWSIVLSAIAVIILAVWDGVEVSHIQHHGHQASAS